MKTKEEIKAKMSALVDEAYESGAAMKAAELEQRIEAERQAYFEKGKEAGFKEAMDSRPSIPADGDSGQIREFNIENKHVSGFMADTAYDAPGFATGSGLSVVDKYIQSAVEGDTQSPTERPAPIPFDFDSILDQDGVEIPAAGGIRNLVPGRTYTYFKAHGADVSRGTFRTTGTVRMIHTADTHPILNIRDLGGYPCEGGHVAYGRIIRCGRIPKELKKADINAQILRNLGITAEVSFSSSWAARSDLGWRAYTYSIYGYAYILQKPTKYKETFTRILAEAEAGGCTLIHCQAGADRTGTVSAVLLGVLGVPVPLIIKDWELTCFCAWFNRKRISDWAIRTAPTADPETRAIILNEAPYGELREFFVAMKNTFGKNGETYQQQCYSFLTKLAGFTAAQIARLKKALVQA